METKKGGIRNIIYTKTLKTFFIYYRYRRKYPKKTLRRLRKIMKLKGKTKKINIAVLSEEPLGWGSGKHYFPVILNGYTWNTNGVSYIFSTTYIYDKDIIQGRLNVSKFQVLLVPGGGVGDGEAVMKGFILCRKNRKWKKQIQKFIEDGGGYVGICGGTALATSLDTGPNKKPTSFLERQYDKSAIGITCVKSYYENLAVPMFYPFQWNHPEKIGATGYIFSFAPGETIDGKRIHTGGVPVDFKIYKDNPIFSDYPDETIRMRWWGGPGFVVPEKTDRDVKILARYPKDDFSKNHLTQIYAWRYTGGVSGLIKAFLNASSIVKKEKEKLKQIPIYTYYLAKPWEPTSRRIELNFSNKPCMTAEVYPNKNQGRILLCTAHPEYMIWWNGHIEEVKHTKNNCLAYGFHKWKNISKLSKNVEKELTHTWWVVRRITAWAAKVPDEHLPPISKEEINKKTIPIIKQNIFWDGTLLNQMKNI